MLSVSTISAGSGYQYLTKEVVTGAEDYYVRGVTEIGERPGQWIGSGAELLGLEGVVRPEQMARMYGQGLHPDASPENPQALGPPFQSHKSVADRLAEARKANPEADAEEWERIEHKIRKAGERNAVAGFDLTFSPPKSWSVLWAAAPNEAARETIWAAHHEGVTADGLPGTGCLLLTDRARRGPPGRRRRVRGRRLRSPAEPPRRPDAHPRRFAHTLLIRPRLRRGPTEAGFATGSPPPTMGSRALGKEERPSLRARSSASSPRPSPHRSAPRWRLPVALWRQVGAGNPHLM